MSLWAILFEPVKTYGHTLICNFASKTNLRNMHTISRLIALTIATASTLATSAQGDSIMGRQLEEIVVTGSNNAVSRNLIPYTVSVIGKKNWRPPDRHSCCPPSPDKSPACS